MGEKKMIQTWFYRDVVSNLANGRPKKKKWGHKRIHTHTSIQKIDYYIVIRLESMAVCAFIYIYIYSYCGNKCRKIYYFLEKYSISEIYLHPFFEFLWIYFCKIKFFLFHSKTMANGRTRSERQKNCIHEHTTSNT